ncbi:hypothetical protein ON064_07345 [Planococcus sp. A6]|uniref:hypothetical protein n=1 Tax=Planococcus sp. A6 TaxID=2992760 RepID=UPI00237B8C2D|nr:hypothetical protein [Planococcus sp. A6]MDE0582854.1 hypothetical protein [Planococcus sp. A6]
MKCGSGRYASTGVSRMPEAAFFSRTGQSAYDPRGRPLQLDKKKSGSARLAPIGIRRSGEAAPFAAQPEWLMTRASAW